MKLPVYISVMLMHYDIIRGKYLDLYSLLYLLLVESRATK